MSAAVRINAHPLPNFLVEGILKEIENETANRKRIDLYMKTTPDCEGLKLSRKLGVRKEKFYRYVYNMDLENAKKYHLKIKETMLELLDSAMESEGCRTFMDSDATNEYDMDTIQMSKNEGGALTLANHMKEFDSIASGLLTDIKRWLKKSK